MEEWVGQAWHHLVSRAARRDFPDAAVTLDEVRQPASILFRAFGGEPGLSVEAARESTLKSRRRFLDRIAGSGNRIELAWRDGETLRLPARIACFPQASLNRDLYLWLAALAAQSGADDGDWLQSNTRASARLLRHYPGLGARYRRLVTAHLQLRPDPERLSADEAEQERRIRDNLLHPRAWSQPLPAARRAPQPVPLWLHPDPPLLQPAAGAAADPEEGEAEGASESVESDKRRGGERVDMPDGRDGLLAFRLESLFTRAEYVNVDRTTEDNEDRDAKSAIEDMEQLSIARDRTRTATKLRFDLDLPPEEYDDFSVGEGIPLPEWDYRKQLLQPDHCHLQPMLARDVQPVPLPAHLHSRARHLRAMFETLNPRRIWIGAQADGSELDLNAVLEQAADRLRGTRNADALCFRSFERRERDLACLLLADLSLSTDAHINNDQRVIEVIRDSLFLFSEALAATGDRFALYGFSSRRRQHVRVHTLKQFDESWSDQIRGRIQDIKPGYYTRMGAAIRYATRLLEQQNATQKLLLILTDGKPNDLDKYEGRYGIEDTRRAVHEAIRAGLKPFCVTIDEKARDYLPYLFGSGNYLLVRNAGELPAKLPALYARLTA